MKDPLCVAFEIKYPWKHKHFDWRRAFITVWHKDASDYDHGVKCKNRWRWHFWHWEIVCDPLLTFKRWAFSRCAGCGKGFAWGYCPGTTQWGGGGPRWFRSEPKTYHMECMPK